MRIEYELVDSKRVWPGIHLVRVRPPIGWGRHLILVLVLIAKMKYDLLKCILALVLAK